ncbi:MAG: hypothetical protein WCS37_06190 [Chloroflexota bacterium]|nr:hypothetical protein [Chloroflexota bacterium]
MTAMQEETNTLSEHDMRMELFTEYHRIEGEVKTTALRTNGVLNANNHHLILSKVSTSSLIRPQDSPIESGIARIAKRAVVLAVPNEEPDNEYRLLSGPIYNRNDLLQRRVLLVMGNYEINGNLHLDQELDLEKVLLERPESFIGITNAGIIYLPNPNLKFAANTILINKQHVEFICAGAP